MNLDRAIALVNHYERMMNILYLAIFIQIVATLLLLWYNSYLRVDRKAQWDARQRLEIENSRLRVLADTRGEVIEEMVADFKKGVVRDI